MIALSFHGVKITVKTNSVEDCIVNKDSTEYTRYVRFPNNIREEVDAITMKLVEIAILKEQILDKEFAADQL